MSLVSEKLVSLALAIGLSAASFNFYIIWGAQTLAPGARLFDRRKSRALFVWLVRPIRQR